MDTFLSKLFKHRALVTAVCAVLLVAATYFAADFINNVSGATFAVDGSQTRQTEQLLRARFPGYPSEQDVVVFHSNTLTTKDQAFQQLIAQTQQSLKGKPHVTRLISPYDEGSEQQVSADGHTALLIIQLQGKDDELQKNTASLRTALPAPGKDVALYLTGSSPLNADVIEQESKDIEQADIIGLPVAFVVLLLAFGTVVAAGLPLLLSVLGIVTTFGVLGVISHFMQFDIFVESAVTMIGLALGIDYCLMIVTRFREELASGQPPLGAVVTTIKTAGHAVLFSGFTVLVSLSGLLLVQSPLFRGIAAGTMVTVGVMLVFCLTLLPITLGLLGHRINAGKLLGRRQGPDRERQFWATWAHSVMRRPIIVTVGVVVVLLTIAYPAYNLRLGLNLGTATLKDQSSAVGLRLIEQHFSPGAISPIQVVLSRANGPFTNEDLAILSNIGKKLTQDTRVKAVSSLPQTLDAIAGKHDTAAMSAGSALSLLDGQLNVRQGSNVTVMTVVPRAAPDSAQAMELFQDITNSLMPGMVRDSSLHVGYFGTTAQIHDLNSEVERSTPIVLTFVLGLSFVLLAFTFRSLLLPLKAIIMNLLALAAVFGLVVLVFQQGLGAQLLDFSSPGYIQNYLPLLTFVILFGLSMDYEVFLLSRIREAWLKTGDNTQAVATGLEHTAKVITHAAAIMMVVFLSFLIAHMLEVKQLGFALAVAVFIDATLIRLLLVPAAMRLMGKWNWWAPRFRKRKTGRTL